MAQKIASEPLVAVDFIHFDPKYRVLACTRYQYAIPLDSLAGHLQDRHYKDLKPQQRLE
jgi:hypothetical protein